MKRTSAVLVAGLLALSCGYAARADEDRGAPSGKPLRVETTWEPVNQSLTDLINSGAKLVSAGFGMGGPTATIVKDGHYILCGIETPGGLAERKIAESECYRIN
ncbi:hypothetical protein AA0472_2149 [Acetobacter estunensis NRIC 0472]|uniref:Uncharacterized protein n=1 Tax=Acetobacter estunensis TaxID=104097 RepID=A0A967B6Z5_9PROT|nr:hypothetical protein [Acetobacter estunensis]NHO55025.1 hypothetical protein [Acetobacter estunensis]GBQ26555.1 hypothetical protein AA0472_2149 [Acetobacter estunensis NRIC 0472]